MRSYDQYCGLAKALDVVGDRWTLLIVRELFIAGAARYTDLQYGLPGIATNLLADRLRHLEAYGVITREVAPPPVATTLFRLTPRGEELRDALVALGRWGFPLLPDSPEGREFRSHWLVFPLEMTMSGPGPEEATTVEVRVGEQPLTVEAGKGRVRVRPGPAKAPDATVAGSPVLVLRLFRGDVSVEEAEATGLVVEGERTAIERLRAARVPA